VRICPYCKKQVSSEDKFCGWCGKKLPTELELIKEEERIVQTIKEKAREAELKKKEAEEKEEKRKITTLAEEKAKKEAEKIEKEKSKREQIIEKLTRTPEKEEEKRESYLKTIGVKKPKIAEKILAVPKIKEAEVIFRPLSQIKPSSFEKIWIRAIILIFIFSMMAAILVFGFDIFKLREGVNLPPPSEEEVLPPESKIIEEPEELIIPLSLLLTEEETLLEIPSLVQLPVLFSELIKSGNLKEKVFTRILIKNLEENKIVSLKEFLEAAKVETPEGFYLTLKPDLTLFTFAPEDRQLGFMAEIKEEKNLRSLLTLWEKEIVADFSPFFSLLGKEKLMVSHPLKDKAYLGQTFRYTTFYQENLGMYYGIIPAPMQSGKLEKNYFIFTTSEEIMLKLIEYKAELTKDLKIGDRETEVEILQTWLAKDPKIYPEALVTGFFGTLTQAAVIRFQQKYSDEILKPWGLVEGTGIADKSTRKKLNEVYQR